MQITVLWPTFLLLMDELFTVYQKSRCGVCSCLSSGHTYCSSVILLQCEFFFLRTYFKNTCCNIVQGSHLMIVVSGIVVAAVSVQALVCVCVEYEVRLFFYSTRYLIYFQYLVRVVTFILL